MTRSIAILLFPCLAACGAAPPAEDPQPQPEPAASAQSEFTTCVGVDPGASCPSCEAEFLTNTVQPCCRAAVGAGHTTACGCTHPVLGPKVCVEQEDYPWQRVPMCRGGDAGVPLECWYSVCDGRGAQPCRAIPCSDPAACCASPSTCPVPF